MAEAGGLGDLGILTVPVEVDLGPLLAGFDKARAESERAGKEAAEAFEAAAAVAANNHQKKVADEAADAFKTMGEVQRAAANKAAGSLKDMGDAAVKLRPRFRFASESADRLALSFNATRLSGKLAGRMLGEVSGAGHFAGSVMGSIAAKAGPWGVAIATVATSLAIMFKSFTMARTAANDIAEIDKVVARLMGRQREINEAQADDQRAASANAALAASQSRLSDMGLGFTGEKPVATNSAEIVALRHKVEVAEERVLKAQIPINASVLTLTALSPERKEEGEALGERTTARDNLTAAINRQAYARDQADEVARDEEETRSRKALTEANAEAAKARKAYADETLDFRAREAALTGGEDPELVKRRREIQETKDEAARLQRAPDALSKTKGMGLEAQSERMQEALDALQHFQATSALDTIQTETVARTAEALRRIDDLRRTDGEKALAEIEEQHAAELREIEKNGALTGDAKVEALRLVHERQAQEVAAATAEDEEAMTEVQRQIDQAVAEEAATGAQREVLIARAKWDELIKLAESKGLETVAIVKAMNDETAKIQAAPPKGGAPAKTEEERAARQHELYSQGVTQKVIAETLDREGYALEENTSRWHRNAMAVGESRAARLAMAEERLREAKANEQAALFRQFKQPVIGPAGMIFGELTAQVLFGLSSVAHAETARAAEVLRGLRNPYRAATGLSGRVGGTGGTDSKMVTMALTPGELVDVRRPTDRDMGGGAVVEVRNFGAKVQEESADGGRRVILTIENQLARRVVRGGVLGRTLMRVTGSRRKGVQR